MKKSIILMLFMCMFIFTPMVEAECKYGFPSPPLPTNGTWKKDVTQYLYTSSTFILFLAEVGKYFETLCF